MLRQARFAHAAQVERHDAKPTLRQPAGEGFVNALRNTQATGNHDAGARRMRWLKTRTRKRRGVRCVERDGQRP